MNKSTPVSTDGRTAILQEVAAGAHVTQRAV